MRKRKLLAALVSLANGFRNPLFTVLTPRQYRINLNA